MSAHHKLLVRATSLSNQTRPQMNSPFVRSVHLNYSKPGRDSKAEVAAYYSLAVVAWLGL